MWNYPYLTLVCLNLADFWGTSRLIERDGYSVEGNPLLYNWMVSVNSVYPIFVMKSIPLIILGFALFYFGKYIQRRAKLIRNTLWVLNAGLCLIVGTGILMLYDL
jgi:hypothetical protein